MPALHQKSRDEAQDQPGPEAGEPARDAPKQALDRERRGEHLEQGRDATGERADGDAGRDGRPQHAGRRPTGRGRDHQHEQPDDVPGQDG